MTGDWEFKYLIITVLFRNIHFICMCHMNRNKKFISSPFNKYTAHAHTHKTHVIWIDSRFVSIFVPWLFHEENIEAVHFNQLLKKRWSKRISSVRNGAILLCLWCSVSVHCTDIQMMFCLMIFPFQVLQRNFQNHILHTTKLTWGTIEPLTAIQKCCIEI